MPIELTNFTVWGRQWFEDGWEGLRRFCAEAGLAGVELLASGATPEMAPPLDLVRGVHLRSLGSWLPLAGLEVADFVDGDRRYAACTTYRQLVETRADELRQVAALAPDYAVWHGAYAPVYAGGDGHLSLSAGQFLEHLAGLVRDVCSVYRPPYRLLFENAYGVGIGPAAADETVAFLGHLTDLPVGLVLDIGHHLNTRRDLDTPRAACAELKRVAQAWRRRGLRADALHLHWTPPQVVPPQSPEQAMRDFAARKDAAARADVVSVYFERSDRHFPLDHPDLAEAVESLAPDYVVHEMGALSLDDHRTWLARQTAAMRGTPGPTWQGGV